MQTDTLPLQPIIAGRYHDEFRKIDGAWCFIRRHMFSDLHGNLSEHLPRHRVVVRYVGTSVRRNEDPRLLTGRGTLRR